MTEQQTGAEATETTPAALVPSSTMEDVVGDPSPENPAEAGDLAPVEPAAGEPAAPVVEAPAVVPTGDAVAVADELPEPPLDAQPEQLEDGTWQLGKYKADDLLSLVVEVNKARQNVEKLVGAKTEALLDPNVNPFLVSDEELADIESIDDEEPFDESELGDAFGAGIAKALVDAGIVSQQSGPDPAVAQQAAVAQSLGYAQQVIDNPNAGADDFRAALGQLIASAPHDAKSRSTVLAEWASRGPEHAVAAAQEAAQIEVAFAQFQQQQAQLQAHEKLVAQQEAEQAATTAAEQSTQAERDAYATAVAAFVERAPDWQQHDPAMKAWMAQHKPLLASARGNEAAIYAVFQAAYDHAKSTAAVAPGAGIAGGVSEQGSNMNVVTSTETAIDPGTASRAHIEDQRVLAGLETGAAVDDVNVVVTDPNPPGLAQTPLGDLLGVELVS